jgi:hypothetical protein
MANRVLPKLALAALFTLTAFGCAAEAPVEKTPEDLEISRQQHIDRSNAERGMN